MGILSIIIVTYNAAEYIEQCLESVVKGIGNIKAQIVIVDNASDDMTVNIVRRFDEIEVLQNETNVGFAKACNRGIRYSDSEFVAIVNADTVMNEDALSILLQFLESNRNVGIVGPRLLFPNGHQQYSMGSFPSIFNLAMEKIPIFKKMRSSYFLRGHAYYETVQFPDWVMGAFFIVRKDVLKQVGLFDESYFMYVEEVDLCYRIKDADWKVAYNPDAVVIHHNLGSSKERQLRKFVNQRKGILTFFEKFYSEEIVSKLRRLLRLELCFRRMPDGRLRSEYKSVIQNK